MCVCVLLLVIFLLLFFSTRVCCLFLLFLLKTTHAKLDILFCCFFSFFLRFVSSFEQSNGNCMNFYFFCLLVYCLKSGKCIIISVCLFFSKSRSFAVSFPTPISIYQICLLSRYLLLCSVSFQIGHTKMDFFSFFLKFKYG